MIDTWKIVPYTHTSDLEDFTIISAYEEMYIILRHIEQIRSIDDEEDKLYFMDMNALENFSLDNLQNVIRYLISESDIIQQELVNWYEAFKAYVTLYTRLTEDYIGISAEDTETLDAVEGQLLRSGYLILKKELKMETSLIRYKRNETEIDLVHIIPEILVSINTILEMELTTEAFLEEIIEKSRKYRHVRMEIEIPKERIDEFLDVCGVYEGIALNYLDSFTPEEIFKVSLGNNTIEQLLIEKGLI